MKYIIIFLLFLPMVSGLAVSPTSLDFGEVARGDNVVREVLVVNNEDITVSYEIVGLYADSFSLDVGESVVVPVSLEVVDKDDGKYEDMVTIEAHYGSNIVNAVSIPVVYRVSGGDYSEVSFNFDDVKVKGTEWSWWHIVAGVSLLGVGGFAYHKRRKNGKG
tara:strand:- start:8 stop:493 length:486 start_codon:yes stop_codon:yes gene_type:complete